MNSFNFLEILCVSPHQNITAILSYPSNYPILCDKFMKELQLHKYRIILIFSVSVIRSCVIWWICDLTKWLGRNRTSRKSDMTSFWWRDEYYASENSSSI